MSEPLVESNAPEWTVTELSGALRRTLEDRFGLVRVRAELGKVTYHGSGHVYLDLKDEGACIAGVVWRQTAQRLKVKLQQGLDVVATGRITTFPGQSKYQLIIDTIEPAGIGALMALLEGRRQALAAEGLFAAERKRKLPFLPRVVGVVTSPTGAVIRDILHRLEDRFPRRVLLWPVRVQGETCGAEVAAAVTGFNALPPGGAIPRPDVIIVARGGGSIEDLWGFNDEAVVRAVAAGTIPLISAVGHETDWTLIDHAADIRAPTPTGAAEMAVPVRSELVAQAGGLVRRLEDGARRIVEARRTELRSASRALPGADGLLGPGRQRLDLVAARLGPALLANARDHDKRLGVAAAGLARRAPRVALATARERLNGLAVRLVAGQAAALRSERQRIDVARQRLDDLAQRAVRGLAAGRERNAARLKGAGDLLASLGYRSVLARGYALVRDAADRPVGRAAEIAAGQSLTVEFADGCRQVVESEGRITQRARTGRARRKDADLAQESLFDM